MKLSAKHSHGLQHDGNLGPWCIGYSGRSTLKNHSSHSSFIYFNGNSAHYNYTFLTVINARDISK